MAVLGAVVFITVLGNPVGATYKEEKDQSMAQDSGKISAQEVYLDSSPPTGSQALGFARAWGGGYTDHTEVCIQQS